MSINKKQLYQRVAVGVALPANLDFNTRLEFNNDSTPIMLLGYGLPHKDCLKHLIPLDGKMYF